MMISGSTSAYASTTALQNAFKRLDTDGNSSVSKDEFVSSAKNADAASALFDTLASYGTDESGGLTQDGLTSAFAQLSDAMRATLVSAQEGSSEDSTQQQGPDLSALDTDGDGQITEEEFLAGRPDDVSEEDAQALWDSLDSEGTGSLSVADLEEAMAANRPPPPGGGQGGMDVSALDTDGDGQVTEEEFLAGRPDDVSEEDAQALWDSLDSEDAGSLSVDELQAAMDANRPPPPAGTASSEEEDDEDSAISALDTDGDGVISREEFLAGRPDDVSEEMASALWDSMDTEGTGSLSVSEVEDAMAANQPPPPPPQSELAESTTDEDEDDSATTFAEAISSSSSTTAAYQTEMKMMQTLLGIINGGSSSGGTSLLA